MSSRCQSSFSPTGKTAFTRVELLVLIGLALVLASIAYFPVSNYLAASRLNRAVQGSAELATLLSQYATDNDGVYPVGQGNPAVGTSEGIARNFLDNNYVPDASIFAVGSTPRYRGTAQDYSDLAPANISWDFTAGATPTTGITSAAPDLLPVVYTTGQVVTYPRAAGAGLDLPFHSDGPFGENGIVVAYKNKSAVFIHAITSGTTLVCPGFISTSCQDTAAHTQIKP